MEVQSLNSIWSAILECNSQNARIGCRPCDGDYMKTMQFLPTLWSRVFNRPTMVLHTATVLFALLVCLLNLNNAAADIQRNFTLTTNNQAARDSVEGNNQMLLAQHEGQPPVTDPKATYWWHNGSMVYLIANGSSRSFHYHSPRDGMFAAGARPGSLLFTGKSINGS